MEAQREAWPAIDVLDTLLQSEHEFREQKKIETRINTSKLKRKAAMEDIDYSAKRNLQKSQLKDLFRLEWIQAGRPLVISGPTGIGKTFLAEALGLHACRQNQTTLFLSMSTFIESLALARSTSGYLKWRDKLSKPQLLILDDFGLKKLTTSEAHDFSEILKERGTEKSTLITTQVPLILWKEVIPDPVIADTIIDRLIHTALKLALTGESYRIVQAQKLDSKKEGNP
jgi:DNA replication protein DnaC